MIGLIFVSIGIILILIFIASYTAKKPSMKVKKQTAMNLIMAGLPEHAAVALSAKTWDEMHDILFDAAMKMTPQQEDT